jgi:hypothetical protein
MRGAVRVLSPPIVNIARDEAHHNATKLQFNDCLNVKYQKAWVLRSISREEMKKRVV